MSELARASWARSVERFMPYSASPGTAFSLAAEMPETAMRAGGDADQDRAPGAGPAGR